MFRPGLPCSRVVRYESPRCRLPETSRTTGASPRLPFLAVHTAILAVFLLSGAAGLVYEVVWARALSLVFGVTTYATATVLAVGLEGCPAVRRSRAGAGDPGGRGATRARRDRPVGLRLPRVRGAVGPGASALSLQLHVCLHGNARDVSGWACAGERALHRLPSPESPPRPPVRRSGATPSASGSGTACRPWPHTRTSSASTTSS